MSERPVDQVRDELRRLGYLDHKVERFLLQDALKPRRPWRSLPALAAKVALLAGVPAALAGALGLAAVNGHFDAAPFDVLPLFLHLVPPFALAIAAAFLVLGALLFVLLEVSHARRIEALSFALAALTAAAALLVAVWQGRTLLGLSGPWRLTLLAVALAPLAYLLLRAVHGGLLTLSIRLTELPPERRGGPGLWLALGLTVAALLLVLPAYLDVRRPPAETPASLPMSPRSRVAVIGVDGVLASEVDYLLAAGELPGLAALRAAGGVELSYPRRHDEAPASLWTTVATGVPAAEHGLEALDSYRPAGLSRPLTRSGWLRPYWQTLVPTGLADHRPVLAQSRRAWAFWELAARGGGPVLAVGWWGTFPAAPVPGLLVSHGAYQLLAEGAAGVVEPPERAAELERQRVSIPRPELAGRLAAVLPPTTAAAVVDKALVPDAFYRQTFAAGLAARPRAAALYLPGLDIAFQEVTASGASASSVAMADMVRWQLRAVDSMLAEAAAGVDALILVFDPGRRTLGGEQGRVVLWRPDGCGGDGTVEKRSETTPEAVAAAALRALGLPQSAELPEPPPACSWPEPSLRIPTFGTRTRPAAPEGEGEEYLQSLRSLGYL